MAKPALLVVDDDAAERDELKRLLEQEYCERYEVQAVSSGSEALETLRQLKSSNRPVALILANQDLQDTPVVEFFKQAIELFPEAKRVILASYRDADSVIKAINEVGIDHYLVKPCLPAEQNLFPAINDLLKDWETLYRLPFQGVRVVGYRFSPKSFETRDFLVRNSVPFQWIDVERRRALKDFPVQVNSQYLIGNSLSIIPEHAREAECDLLAMGAYADRTTERLSLGSTTEYLMRNSAVPVLVHH